MRLLFGRGAIVAAIALGALTSFIAWRYVDQATGNQPVEMAPVVVANAPIEPRTVITPDLVRVQQLPAQAVHPSALHSTAEVIGKVARTAMTADEQVLTTKLFLQRGESGLALMVPEGMRAVSVNVNEVIGSGGMILPGDHVDVIGIFQMHLPLPSPTASPIVTATPVAPIAEHDNRAVFNQGIVSDKDPAFSTSISTVVLEDVPILAIAQKREGEDTNNNSNQPFANNLTASNPNTNATNANQVQQQQQRSNPPTQPGAKTATMAVSPDDALKLVLAESQGQIRLALRRPANDKDATAKSAPVPVTALKQQSGN
jgi:pilus assembly protein CpaB